MAQSSCWSTSCHTLILGKNKEELGSVFIGYPHLQGRLGSVVFQLSILSKVWFIRKNGRMDME